jgi:hypothetical protein
MNQFPTISPERFAMQMEVFDRMRRTEQEFRAAARRFVGASHRASRAGRAAAPFVPRVFNRQQLAGHPHALLLDRAQHMIFGLQLRRR